MGFMDKLKSMKNAVTGGAAKVYVEFDGDAVRGEPFTVRVKAVIDSAPVKIDKVYLEVKGEEEVEISGVPVARDTDGDGDVDGSVETVSRSHDNFSHTYNIGGPKELAANETYEWEVEIEIPVTCLPSFQSHFCHQDYRLFAGLDAFGNDPDSGWVDFQVQ